MILTVCMWFHSSGQRGQLSRELREGEGKVQMLQSSRANTLLAYGEWMPGIVRAVNAAQSRFRKPPKGPIGAPTALLSHFLFLPRQSSFFYMIIFASICLPFSFPPLSLSNKSENYTILKPLSAPMSCVCVSPNTVYTSLSFPSHFVPLSSANTKGVMFKLRDYRWSTAIEAILGKNLSAFVVDNTYDKKTLEAIMKREIRGMRMIPDIIVSRYTVCAVYLPLFTNGATVSLSLSRAGHMMSPGRYVRPVVCFWKSV